MNSNPDMKSCQRGFSYKIYLQFPSQNKLTIEESDQFKMKSKFLWLINKYVVELLVNIVKFLIGQDIIELGCS